MKNEIVVKEYYYECGDRCCSEIGREWYVNGEYVHRSPCEDSGWLAVLKHLGIDAELIGQDQEGEDIWSL
jgi:hypothetical protein